VGLFTFFIMTHELTELKVSYKPKKVAGPRVTSAESAYEVLRSIFNQDLIDLREEFVCLFLNRANMIKGWYQISTGGISGTVADPKLILGIALKTASCCLILSHNHPSGNMKPSDADIKLTEKIKNACKFMDIQVLDHIIVSSSGYLSFADEGFL
jgi:DNA repair protein RadC